jgi:hypothetical protein
VEKQIDMITECTPFQNFGKDKVLVECDTQPNIISSGLKSYSALLILYGCLGHECRYNSIRP